MHPPIKRFPVSILIGLISVVLVGVIFSIFWKPALLANHPPATQIPAAVTNPFPPTAALNTAKPPPAATGVLPNNWDFQKRPFPVAYESAKIQWTMADGKDTNVIRQLAHNSLEYDRMVEENSRIFRRQLVYLKETAAAVFEQAKLTGASVKELTLPGADGQELQFEIAKSDGKGSSRQGMFSGHLAGDPESLVTLAFQDGREAFTILSPKENIFVVGEPREDGEVIVKAIDPNKYGQGPQDADDVVKVDSTKK